jgi:hypothetical protein
VIAHARTAHRAIQLIRNERNGAVKSVCLRYTRTGEAVLPKEFRAP